MGKKIKTNEKVKIKSNIIKSEVLENIDEEKVNDDFWDNKKAKSNKYKKEKQEKLEEEVTEQVIEIAAPTRINKFVLGIGVLSLIILLAIIIYLIIKNGFESNIIPSIILLAVFGLFILVGRKNKKASILIFLGSLLVIGYSLYSIGAYLGYININNNIVLNFYKTSITDAVEWAKKNSIDVEEIYEYSDVIPEYEIISQDVCYGTKLNTINKITFIISLGPDPNKEVVIPNFVGWDIMEVVNYCDTNYLTNVEINFIKSDNVKNTVISQNNSGTMKRSDLIKLSVSLDEASAVNIPDFKNKSLLYASTWLKMHNLKYTENYDYSDDVNKNNIIKCNYSGKSVDPNTDYEEIILVISKGNKIKLPDFKKMTQDEINAWIMENKLRVNYVEEYNEEYALGDIIGSDLDENSVIDNGDTITIKISKGRLEMIEYGPLSEFLIFASNNNIPYSIEYDFSNDVASGNIIRASKKVGEAINQGDSVTVYVSQGKAVTVPNFVGMNKSNAQNKCNELKLSCSFVYGGLTDGTKKDIVIGQNKNSGSTIGEGSGVTISLSSGIYERVTVPSFVGQSRGNIEAKCNSLGIRCSFSYESRFSDSKDVCVSQSNTGTVIKGSNISITLSRGPAKTYNVVIDANQLTAGNPDATKATLQGLLNGRCAGVNFVYEFRTSNFGIGYLHQDSQVKVGNNTFTEGQTYKVIISKS